MTRKTMLALSAALALSPALATAQVISVRAPDGSRYIDESRRQGFGLAAEADRLSKEADEINTECQRLEKLGERLADLKKKKDRALNAYRSAKGQLESSLQPETANEWVRMWGTDIYRNNIGLMKENVVDRRRDAGRASDAYAAAEQSFNSQVSQLSQRIADWEKDNEILKRRVREAAGSR